jgi:hypothetical protein
MTKQFITKTDLISIRKWTDRLIKKYMPVPDEIRNNPHYKQASKMKLYKISRVESIEKNEQFLIDFQKTILRRKSSAKMVETKKDNLLIEIFELPISVEIIPRNELVPLVIDNYNKNKDDYKGYSSFRDFDQSKLERLTVNYIRHELTPYDYYLKLIVSKVGKKEGYRLLRERIYNCISESYPELTRECTLQFRRKFYLNN